MKVAIINRSDDTGGAAVVSRRLMDALRRQDVDAQMVVCEKRTSSPYIHLAASPRRIKAAFLAERLKVFMANGLDRSTLFRIDPASDGLPLHKHPVVRRADVICLGWVNQGMLSLKGIRKLVELGKPVVWTMHDMWCFTGICHHAFDCDHYLRRCGDCPLLAGKASPADLSHKIYERKSALYSLRGIDFVAVSNWLASCARRSSLLGPQPVHVIYNPFNPVQLPSAPKRVYGKASEISLLFGAARLDDPIKGLDILRESMEWLSNNHPDFAARLSLTLFGSIKDASLLEGWPVKMRCLGRISGNEALAAVYADADILLAPSRFENLPGTLVEAQAYGAVPVAFLRGGQDDIIDDGSTGVLVNFDADSRAESAANFARGIMRAADMLADSGMAARMRESVARKFAAPVIAGQYVELFKKLLSKLPSYNE